MKRELEHFYIGESYGGNQDWFSEYMMRLGGCAAETACDSSVFFDLEYGTRLYPGKLPPRSLGPEAGDELSEKMREEYCLFASEMKPYIRPRWSGVYLLSMYIDGFSLFLKDRGESRISMEAFSGDEPYEKAEKAVRRQIDKGLPIPTLVLNHKNKAMKEYIWHWFLINGYDDGSAEDGIFRVKAVTYSEYEWVDLSALWDTGSAEKGGLVLYSFNK